MAEHLMLLALPHSQGVVDGSLDIYTVMGRLVESLQGESILIHHRSFPLPPARAHCS